MKLDGKKFFLFILGLFRVSSYYCVVLGCLRSVNPISEADGHESKL